MKTFLFQKTLDRITNYWHFVKLRKIEQTLPPLFCWWSFLQSTCAWACYIPKKTWVYVNLDRITKSCPWPTFKVQCWWEKDVFYSGIFLWVSYESYFGYYQGVYSQYKIRRILFYSDVPMIEWPHLNSWD